MKNMETPFFKITCFCNIFSKKVDMHFDFRSKNQESYSKRAHYLVKTMALKDSFAILHISVAQILSEIQ